MKKVLISIFILVLFHTAAVAQDSHLGSDANLAIFQNSLPLSHNQSNQLFLLYMYRRYEEYIVYKNAPYKGLSFKMNGLLVQNRFWNLATFGIGAFTWDFKEAGGNKVGGLLFDHPIYLGWDFKLHNQFYLSTGSTLLEQRYDDNNVQKTLLFNSFVGLNGKFMLKSQRLKKVNEKGN